MNAFDVQDDGIFHVQRNRDEIPIVRVVLRDFRIRPNLVHHVVAFFVCCEELPFIIRDHFVPDDEVVVFVGHFSVKVQNFTSTIGGTRKAKPRRECKIIARYY